MSDLSDTVAEAIEKSEETPPAGGGGSNLNGMIALSVAIIATFIALCNVKAGNITQAMQQAQANSVDAWAYFQAKGTKLNIAESARDTLILQREIAPSMTPEARGLVDKKIADYDAKIRLYEKEKGEIKASAEGFKQEYERLNLHDDQFDMADALMSVAIALLGITALTRKRRLMYLAWGFAGFGLRANRPMSYSSFAWRWRAIRQVSAMSTRHMSLSHASSPPRPFATSPNTCWFQRAAAKSDGVSL